MIGAAADFLLRFPTRLARVWRLAFDPECSQTYYPDEPRKGRGRVFWENLWWLLRHQEVNASYYMYGFDRNGVDTSDYLSAGESRKLRTRERRRIARSLGGLQYECIANDKFLFGQFLTSMGVPTPRILGLWNGQAMHWMDGDCTDLDALAERTDDAVLKSCLGLQGRAVLLYRVRDGRFVVDGEELDVEALRAKLNGPWLVQERIVQCDEMSRLHPASVNTIRLVTVLRDGKAEPFLANLRAGVGGKSRDNWSIGGLTAAVDVTTGKVGRYGSFKPGYGTHVLRHPDSGIVLEGFQIPFWSEAVEMVTRLHPLFYGFHSLGWDVAMTPQGPIIVEVNHDWLMTFMQAVNGPFRQRFIDTLPSHDRPAARRPAPAMAPQNA